MRQTRLIVMLGCLGVITLFSGALRAQSPRLGPWPGVRPLMHGGPDMFNFMSGKTVAGAPYSAQVNFERTQKLADGNFVDQKSSAMVYRDGQGRTRIEETRPTNSATPQRVIRIADSVGGVGYVLDPAKKTAYKFTLPSARLANSAQSPRSASNPNANSLSLGSKNMEGLFVQGTQTTHTIPAGQMGNAEAIQVSRTHWHSPDLSIDLRTETTDPLHGISTLSVTNISREEPASTLFEVPSDYTVVSGGPRRRRGSAGAAPAQ
jgi:hypothetical protein